MNRVNIISRKKHRAKARNLYSLPMMICFRVTRFCNARCGFCLAPPDGGIHPPVKELQHRIDWLFANGVKTIHFCGGEPTIHHQLPDLIRYVNDRGKRSKLTTNGIAISDKLIHTLWACNTEVKISLHGPNAHHNEVVGLKAYDRTVSNINRLAAAGVSISVQTTIVRGNLDVVDWMIKFCIDNKIRMVSFLPFISRGNGNQTRSKYELSIDERRTLKDLIIQKRRRHNKQLDIRLLDFNSKPIHVVESDGRVVLEAATEAADILLYKINPLVTGPGC